MEDRPNDAPKSNGGGDARPLMTMAIVFEAALVPLASCAIGDGVFFIRTAVGLYRIEPRSPAR